MDVKDLKVGTEVVLTHQERVKRAIVLKIGDYTSELLKKKVKNWVFLALKRENGKNALETVPFWCDPDKLIMTWQEYRKIMAKKPKKAVKNDKVDEIKAGFSALGFNVIGHSRVITIKLADAERILNILKGSEAKSAPKEGSTLRLLSKN